MPTLLRIVAAVVMLAIAGFCVFGFLASYEYAEPAKRLPWQIGYGVLGLACLRGVWAVSKTKPHSSFRDGAAP